MKKLTLNPDALVVESFKVPSTGDGNGTVRGFDSFETCACPLPPPTADGGITCGNTCHGHTWGCDSCTGTPGCCDTL